MLLLLMGGCRSLQVPAIDPTGERIFLPQPAFTTLESPLWALPGHTSFPRPAFTEPPFIPACPPDPIVAPLVSAPFVQNGVPVGPTLGIPVPVVGPGIPLGQDRLVLSPARIVAPVNSEVILLAGICGPDGYYVTGQPIEWSLAQDSVGQIIDVGETRRQGFRALSHRSPRKLSNDFALTRTSNAARQITRGTPSSNDDVWLRKGQAWISLTSASQGVSHVTAVATGAENWEKRRQVARVHWVDAQWVLPPPAVVRAGAPYTLSTRVTRSSSSRPVTDWTVRYEVAGGSPATFGSTGGPSVDQPTDANGDAAVTITPSGAQAGSSQILIRILSPADGDAPVEVGQGWTTVTWSAPGLAVNASGPELAAPGVTIVYRIEVRNTGDLPAENVRVTATVSPNLEVLNSDPPASPTNNQLNWQLGTISAGDTGVLAVRCRARIAGDARFIVSASSGNLSDNSTAITRIEAPSLEVRFVNPPQTARVGQRITFDIRVRNTGSQTLRNIVLRDDFDEGLEHSEGESSPIGFELAELLPGQEDTKAVSFVIRRTGQLCHTIAAQSEGGYTADDRTCVTVERANLGVRVDKHGPAQAVVGETICFDLQVTNTGDAPLTGVQVVDTPGRSFEPIKASDDHVNILGTGLLWQIDTLAPGETRDFRVECRCLGEDSMAANRAEVTTAEGLSDAASATTAIVRASAIDTIPRRGGVPPLSLESQGPRRGEITLKVTDIDDRIQVGETTTYIIEITNDRDEPARNVVVVFSLPEGLRRPTTDPSSPKFFVRDDGQYQFEPIQEMRPGGSEIMRVKVEATQPGFHTFQARIISPEERSDVEQTQVLRREP
jgi:uncharacterized repeat protein (TIGR01451 family)